MSGWTDPETPAHYIGQANREKLGTSGLQKVVVFDQRQSLDDFLPLAELSDVRTPDGNGNIPG